MSKKSKETYENRILWIAPELNHYKIKQMNRLSTQIKGIKVLNGLVSVFAGHKLPKIKQINFDQVTVDSTKDQFGWNLVVFKKILSEIRHNNFKIVVMPMEKKHILLIFFLYILKFAYKFKLASYNHHYIKRKSRANRFLSFLDRKSVRIINRLYDIIIYYTEAGMHRSIDEKMVNKCKAFFANNTIDVENIFSIADKNETKSQNAILFIGRMLANKRIDILLEYFREIKEKQPDCKLYIIGGGPELEKSKKLSEGMKDVYWLGGIVEEEKICEYMEKSKIVFVPGHSGLSINHSFAYKKPYITLERESHPPEIDYIVNGENGLILPADDKENNINKMIELLTNDSYYNKMSASAYQTAQKLTLENWVTNMRNALQL